MGCEALGRAGLGGVVEIDRAALVANWRGLRARHGAPIAAVVKADGYGLGAGLVAPPLLAAGCRDFFVAHFSEALALRALLAPDGGAPEPAATACRIMVLNGVFAGDEAECAERGIVPVLNSLDSVARWGGEAARRETVLPALLHVDTGMSRLGLSEADWGRLLAEPARLRGIRLRYLMTHLAAAEQPENPLNGLQAARFARCRAAMAGVATSFANSAGLFLGPRFRSDLARPGIGLFGGNPTPDRANPQAPVVRLTVRVLQVREIGVGVAVGYEATWRARRPTRIATACVGYADGWSRALSNRGHACFDGARLALVGRVSMDLVTYDATDCPGLREGDWLELIGPGCTLDEVAALAGTNAYEILTSLGARYQRRLVAGDGAGTG